MWAPPRSWRPLLRGILYPPLHHIKQKTSGQNYIMRIEKINWTDGAVIPSAPLNLPIKSIFCFQTTNRMSDMPKNGRSRISQTGGADSEGGRQLIIWPNFTRKLHKDGQTNKNCFFDNFHSARKDFLLTLHKPKSAADPSFWCDLNSSVRGRVSSAR